VCLLQTMRILLSPAKRILFDYIIMPFNPFVPTATAPVVFINSAMRYGARQSIRQRGAAQSITAGGYGM
jgi:hypothetical protein